MPWPPVQRALAKLERLVARRRQYDLLQLTLRDQLLTHQVDLVVDVGANHGQYRDLLRHRVGYEGPILSFEPIPALAEELRRRSAADPAWQVVPSALGAEEGRSLLHVMAGDDFSSQLVPSEYGATQYAARVRTRERIEVPVRRLDRLLPELRPDWAARRIHLKIDTQGTDAAVLEGAAGVLPAVCTIQIELAFLRIYEGVPPAHQVLARLAELGFDVCGLYSVSGRDRGRLVEVDCVAVKREVALAQSGLRSP